MARSPDQPIVRVLSNCDDQSRRKKQGTTLAFRKAGQTGLAGACLLDAAWWSVARLRRKFAESWLHATRLSPGRRAQSRAFPQGTGRRKWTQKLAAGFPAGWRATVRGTVEKGVGEMRKHFESDPRNLVAAIGPGVQGCCYEVGEEVRAKFEAQFAYASSLFRQVKESDPVREKYPLLFLTARAPGHSELPVKLFLDLLVANRRQLLDAGVMAKNIEAVGPCTACHTELLFSYRGEKGVTGRMMAAAGIRPE